MKCDHVATTDPPRVQANDEAKAADVNAAVEELLNTLSNKFAGISSEIFAKSEYFEPAREIGPGESFRSIMHSDMFVPVDEMSRRLDNLEAALLADKEKEGGQSSAKPS